MRAFSARRCFLNGIFFAYDGSIHADWISHYAIRLAARHPAARLSVVHIFDGDPRETLLEEKLLRIQSECRRLGVEFDVQHKRLSGTVDQTVCSVIPPGPESLLVCGTRAEERRRGWLSGTFAERMLQARHCNVVTIRVLQPGLLGLPRRVLLPLSGRLDEFRSWLPFLRLLQPDITHLQILHVAQVSGRLLRLLSHERAEQLRQTGESLCLGREQELSSQLSLPNSLISASVVVSDDVSREIMIAANRSRSRLICLAASDRSLTQRVFHGNLVERVLESATCDVAICRGVT